MLPKFDRRENFMAEKINKNTLMMIFDDLEGKTYPESRDILKMYCDEILINVVRKCQNPQAKAAARTLLDEGNYEKKIVITTTKPIGVAIIIIALLAIFVPSLISHIQWRSDEKIIAVEVVSAQNSVLSSSGTNAIVPLPDEIIPIMIPYEDTAPIGTLAEEIKLLDPIDDDYIDFRLSYRDFLDVYWSAAHNTYTGRFIHDFTIHPRTDQVLADTIRNREHMVLYVLSDNFPDLDSALERFYKEYDGDRMGNPNTLNGLWVEDLEGAIFNKFIPNVAMVNDMDDELVTNLIIILLPDDSFTNASTQDIDSLVGEQVVIVNARGTVTVGILRRAWTE
jgi:hypothetical protein